MTWQWLSSTVLGVYSERESAIAEARRSSGISNSYRNRNRKGITKRCQPEGLCVNVTISEVASGRVSACGGFSRRKQIGKEK